MVCRTIVQELYHFDGLCHDSAAKRHKPMWERSQLPSLVPVAAVAQGRYPCWHRRLASVQEERQAGTAVCIRSPVPSGVGFCIAPLCRFCDSESCFCSLKLAPPLPPREASPLISPPPFNLLSGSKTIRANIPTCIPEVENGCQSQFLTPYHMQSA